MLVTLSLFSSFFMIIYSLVIYDVVASLVFSLFLIIKLFDDITLLNVPSIVISPWTSDHINVYMCLSFIVNTPFLNILFYNANNTRLFYFIFNNYMLVII